MDEIKKVFGQTTWQVIGKAITSSSTIILLGILSRVYGENGTGIFTLGTTFLAFFILAADFGVNSHLLGNFIKQENSLEWRKLLGLRLILSFILIALCYFIVLFWPNINLSLLQIIFIGAPFAILESAIFVTCNIIFQSKLRYDLILLSTVPGVLITLLSALHFSQNHLTLPFLMVSYLLGWLVMIFTSLLLVKKYVTSLFPIFDFAYIAKILKESWPISATLILNTVYFRVDAFILSAVQNFSNVGVYNLAYQVFQAALVIPTFIMNGYFPIMLKNYGEEKKRFRRNLMFACLIMFLIGLAGTIFTFFLSPLVIMLLTGNHGFAGAVDALRILAFGFPAFFVSSVLIWTFITLKKYKTMLLIYLIGLLINLILNLIYIPQYSFIAAAYVTGISEYLILLLQLLILVPALKKQ